MTADQQLTKFGITVKVGHDEFVPGPGVSSRILEAAQRHTAGRLPGLPDDLNPVILDPARVRAFLIGFSKLPTETLNALRGRILFLNDPQLQLQAPSAIPVPTLESGFKLQVDPGPPGAIASAHLVAPIDKNVASQRAQAARHLMMDLDEEVKALEAQRDREGTETNRASALLRNLSRTQAKRYAAASVWRDMTDALSKLDPKSKALNSEAAAAKKAAAKFIVAPWTGMP